MLYVNRCQTKGFLSGFWDLFLCRGREHNVSRVSTNQSSSEQKSTKMLEITDSHHFCIKIRLNQKNHVVIEEIITNPFWQTEDVIQSIIWLSQQRTSRHSTIINIKIQTNPYQDFYIFWLLNIVLYLSYDIFSIYWSQSDIFIIQAYNLPHYSKVHNISIILPRGYYKPQTFYFCF